MIRCPRCSEDNPAHARFCLGCGLALERPAATGEAEERKVVTAVFVDLVGSTAAAESSDPEDVRSRLVPYHDRVRRELELHGGTVEKFIGDAVVAVFGAPIGNEDDPERAVRAAFAVRDAVEDLNATDAWLALSVRIGVATGEALVRLGANLAEGETLAMGDVMNTAARIQSAAKPGRILVSRPTQRATAHAVDYAAREPLEAKGKREPVQVWEAVAPRAARHRGRSDAPFVGRERELSQLRQLWAAVGAERRPSTALVVAEPGMGKTRLLAAFVETLGAEAFWGRCQAYGEGGAYGPVAEMLAAIGVDRVLAEADGPERQGVADALASVLATGAGAEITRGELHWGIRRAFELVSRDPIVLVFEDLHWADPALLELLGFLEEASAPLLVLASARPDLAERGDRVVLELPPLSAGESQALVDELLGGVADRPALEPVVEAARGNPLFLEETVHMLADEGLVSGAAPPDRLPAPPSLTSMIGARLDRLPATERHLALRAAVLGSAFWPGAIERLNGPEDVEDVLESLARLDVVEERPISTVTGEREFAFKHELIREVAYDRLPKGLRAELHVRSAEWFATRQARDEYAEIGAYHLEQACRLAQQIERSPVSPPILDAAEALRAAAEKAERREGLEEADRFYVRALELVVDEEHPVLAAELRLRRARTLAALGRLDEATDRFTAVASDAGALGRADLRGAALVGLGNALQKLGKPQEARAHVVEAKAIADEAHDTRLEVQALFELAELDRDFTGEIDAAVSGLRTGLELAASLGDRQLLAEGQLRLGFALGAAGELASAEEALIRSAEIAAELGSRRDEARANFVRAFIAYHRGRPEEAERLALDVDGWFERAGDSYFRVQSLRALATYARARGDTAGAEDRLRQALALAGPTGWLSSALNADLAELLVALDRVEEAEAAAALAVGEAPAGDPSAGAAAGIAAAAVAAANGNRVDACRLGEDALRTYVELAVPYEVARARVVFARALAAVGEEERAAAELRLAADACVTMGASTLLAAAESALAALPAR